jgi:hypothetical protein
MDDVTEPLLKAIPKASQSITISPVHFSRWQSFAGVCLFVSTVGTTYAFGAYSDLLKINLGFSQSELDIIASFGNTGLYLSILGGLLLERFGIHIVVNLGCFLIFVGFLYIFLAVEDYVPANLLSVSISFFISQFGVCLHVSTAVTCAIRLFPSEVLIHVLKNCAQKCKYVCK